MNMPFRINAPSREAQAREPQYIPPPDPYQHTPTCSPSREVLNRTDEEIEAMCGRRYLTEYTRVGGSGRGQLTVQQQTRRLPDSSYIEVSEDGVHWFVIENIEARR